MGVTNRVAVVTGAGGGIGLGIAEGLARRGASVAVLDIDAEAASAAAAAIRGARGSDDVAVAHAVDLTDGAAVTQAITAVAEAMGSVDILVNNAGVIAGPTDIDATSDEEWEFVLGTNTKALLTTSRAAVPIMKRAGFGRIINIASRSWLGVAGRAHYAASKGAVVSFTRSLAIELGPHGITANCISPTLVVTPLFERTPDKEEVMRRVRAQPIPRPGTVEDIALAVAFFADDDASFITGQHIYVGGGGDLMTATP